MGCAEVISFEEVRARKLMWLYSSGHTETRAIAHF